MPEGGNVPFQVLRSEKQWKTKGNCKQAERESVGRTVDCLLWCVCALECML